MTRYPRWADTRLGELMEAFPAVLITGARAVGKTTTAASHVVDRVRLDSPRERALYVADPDAALASARLPVLLDEWQVVPEVLGAVKRAVDDHGGAGRFVLTGSAYPKPGVTPWAGTGRVINLPMAPLSQAEAVAADVGALARVLDSPVHLLLTERSPTTTVSPGAGDVFDVVERALGSGFPPAMPLLPTLRRVWLDDYLRGVVERDPIDIGERVDTVLLHRYLDALIAVSATVATDQSIRQAAGISTDTGRRYHDLLTRMNISVDVPSWASNRLTGIAKAPKRMVCDASFLARSIDSVRRDGVLLGRVLETFVHQQLVPVAALGPVPFRIFHLRSSTGHREVDLLLERDDGRVVGVEVKATASPSPIDAGHLHWLADRLGDRMLGGIVLHTGAGTLPLGPRVWAAPISSLWSAASSDTAER